VGSLQGKFRNIGTYIRNFYEGAVIPSSSRYVHIRLTSAVFQ